jgi:hypothetical protein
LLNFNKIYQMISLFLQAISKTQCHSEGAFAAIEETRIFSV